MRRRLSLVATCILLAWAFPLLTAEAALTVDHKAITTEEETTDANIAEIEGDTLQTWQFSQHPFDQEIAGRFLDRYLETLDYSHLYFVQPDIDQFKAYRTNLQTLTMQDHDVSPCWIIFDRFMDHARERTQYMTNLLATMKFDFTGHDRFVINRHSLPYAKDMAEIREFWRQELRCEYLDQLLSAQGMEFSGKVNFATNEAGRKIDTITFQWEKSHALDFAHFPKSLLGKDGHPFGLVEFSNGGSNATVRLQWQPDASLTNASNTFYGANGVKLGDIRFHSITTIPSAPGSTNLATNAGPAAAVTNYLAVIHLDETNYAAIRKNLATHYTQMLDNYKELARQNDRVFEMYMDALARAYDPHSSYMGHLQAENFAIQMKLSLFGIGAILTKEENYCKIMELKEGPAKRSGQIKEGDRIVAVEQGSSKPTQPNLTIPGSAPSSDQPPTNAEPVDVVGMPLDKIVEMIRGPKGTQVTLTVIPVDAPDSVRKEVTLIRDEIKLEDQQAKATLYALPATSNRPALKLGVIDLASFYADNDHPEKNTTTDVLRLVNRLKQEDVDGIILDLRRNGGGYLEEAIKLTGLFNPRGPVVQTKDPNGDIVPDTSPEPGPLYDGPLIVLTSVFSASASEIFAGALQDYGRALIVGDHSTFGKGTVQTMQELSALMNLKHLDYSYVSDPGKLKITIKKFYRAGGVSTQLQGVLSDIELPSIDDAADVGERSLPNAMPCDSVTPADHLEELELNRVKPYLADLQSRSHQRIEKDKDFAYMREDIAEFRKEQADKSLSLNEAERRAEQSAEIAKMEARKKERHARKKSDEQIYEITLKNVDSPDLKPVNGKSADVSGDEESSKGKPLDPTLEETKRILADYIELLKRGPGISKAP